MIGNRSDVGCPYPHEENSPAYAHDNTVSDKDKEARVGELMVLQEGIAASLNRKLESRTLKVLIDRIEENVDYGRTEYDAPEVDNDVIIDLGEIAAKEGEFRQAVIKDSSAYELFGRIGGGVNAL
jgi:ribosomal protein S12 methylthiotransferase